MGYRQGGKTSYDKLMIKKLKEMFKKGKEENWGAKQIKAMAKLGGRLVL